MADPPLSAKAAEYLFHHVFLPPKLPQKDDCDAALGGELLGLVLTSLAEFKQHFEDPVMLLRRRKVDSAHLLLSNFQELRESTGSAGYVHQETLLGCLKELTTKPEGGIVLHVPAQNAGVLINRVDKSIHFEVFELAPRNDAVFATKGRLRRSFPGCAVAVDAESSQKPGFWDMVAYALAKMSHQDAPGMQPQARKAGRNHDEDRDTTHPGIITELLTGVLMAIGAHKDLQTITKNTREEVLWADCRFPWRRSPLWLLIRVALQLTLSRTESSADNCGGLYKTFMVYFMSRVLSKSSSLPVDSQWAMSAKIARRMLKLASDANVPVLEDVQKVIQATHQAVHQHWARIQKQDSPYLRLADLATLDFSHDTLMKLPKLDEYLKGIEERLVYQSSSDFQPDAPLAKYESYQIPRANVDTNNAKYTTQNLHAIEVWVARNLPDWIDDHVDENDTCESLKSLLEKYYSVAAAHYSGNPEATSLMLLTIFELWIACDRSAVSKTPLLSAYGVGVPSDVLQSLLLPFKGHMERLRAVELYLDNRRSAARLPSTKVFTDVGSAESFAVKYFDQSRLHQDLLIAIEKEATASRQRKSDELRTLKERYQDLTRQAGERDCEYFTVPQKDPLNGTTYQESQHNPLRCTKCKLEKFADDLKISIHEWPLPANAEAAKGVVFELRVPSFYASWRDCTVYLLRNVLKGKHERRSKPRATYLLSKDLHAELSYESPTDETRLVLLSEDKPHLGTHRKLKIVSTSTESDVCLRNAMKYRYYDTFDECFAGHITFNDEVKRACGYSLSDALHKYIYRPAASPDGVSSNTCIANPQECPPHMSLGEYKELFQVPLGHRLQWHSIALQLRAPGLDFKSPETTMVFLQCIYQAGPPDAADQIERSGHTVVRSEDFGLALHDALEKALQRIRENWESALDLCLLIKVAARLLSLSNSASVRESCLTYLQHAGETALKWVRVLRAKAQQCVEHSERGRYDQKALEIALIGVDSFNVDDCHLQSVLCSTQQTSTLLQCCMVIYAGSHTFRASEKLLDHLNLRYQQLLYRCYRQIQAQTEALDDAIACAWSAFQPGGQWTAASHDSDHWLTTKSASAAGTHGMVVHYNLLTGELLVSGLPLDGLPKDYKSHQTYDTLFGYCSFKVMPSDIPGMRFSGESPYAGYKLHFGMDTSSDNLLVRAEGQGTAYEVLPSSLFREAMPASFITDFVHWYDSVSQQVEFRPKGQPWQKSTCLLTKARHCESWQLHTDAGTLVGQGSRTSNMISGILSCLASGPRIQVTVANLDGKAQIHVPQLQLTFTLDPGLTELHSKEFPGEIIDPDQSAGTLVGFRNKLVLKHQKHSSRRLLLVEGPLQYSRHKGHVRVTAKTDESPTLHAFQVDRGLYRLIDNGSLQSKLFLAYIHALTSYCLADPFTQQSGTERSLTILRAAAVSSFAPTQWTQANVDTLAMIARLAPLRSYYPQNERVMQTIDWDHQLTFLTQHSDLRMIVSRLFDQLRETSVLYPDVKISMPVLCATNGDLMERDAIRSSSFRLSGFGAEAHSTQHDHAYAARDCGQQSSKMFRSAFSMSCHLLRGTASLYENLPTLAHCSTGLWSALVKANTVSGPDAPLSDSDLRYDARLLQPALYDLPLKRFPSLHRKLCKYRDTPDMFHLVLWFATLSAGGMDTTILQALALSLMSDVLSQIVAPAVKHFTTCEGKIASQSILESCAKSGLLQMKDTPAAKLTKQDAEAYPDFLKRRDRLYKQNSASAVQTVASELKAQFPREVPLIPQLATYLVPYIDLKAVISATKTQFQMWYDNQSLFDYLQKLANIMVTLPVMPPGTPSWRPPPPALNVSSGRRFISDRDIFAGVAPSMPHCGPITKQADNDRRMTELVTTLESSGLASRFEEEYVQDLRASLTSWQQREGPFELHTPAPDIKRTLLIYQSQCRNRLDKIYKVIDSSVTTAVAGLFGIANPQPANQERLSPRISPLFLLQQLSPGSREKLSDAWKTCLTQYAISFAIFLRAERLVKCLDSPEDLIGEINNIPHTNWHPVEQLDALLLEVESNITIRKVQEDISREMRSGQSQNCCMQLHMGQGKSSVIVPAVAAALADGTKLSRVVVAKAQSKQMAQMLISKLGGLMNRRVYYLPFSRSLKLDAPAVETVMKIARECMTSRGVLLLQPEHILSFKLMGLDAYISGKESIGKSLSMAQDVFDSYSRDVVDEADDVFSVRFELVYTLGKQQPIELSTARWTCIQQVLHLVRTLAPTARNDLLIPASLEVIESNPGSFPRLRFLSDEARDLLLSRVVDDLCDYGVDGFPVGREPAVVRHAVHEYIATAELTKEQIQDVEDSVFFRDAKSLIYLLRGLIAGGLLSFAFGQKRWRVNYGLTPTRVPPTRLAVPYTAKDNPSARSEFSHPDVVIVLTSLSYYYSGMGDEDLSTAFRHLIRSDQPDAEYQLWMRDAPSLPQAFRTIHGINLQDPHQCQSDVWPHLRHGKAVIDYFLSHIVFPKEMKEFPHKISVSGWDIGQVKGNPTTGFSGTKDSSIMLPLDVKHLDLPEQKHTNALVISQLLQPANSVVLLPTAAEETGTDAERLLRTVVDLEPPVQVILDVGAQILELDNLGVARKWMELQPEAGKHNGGKQAVVFVDENDNLCVVDRRGRTELLHTSSYINRLDTCLVFLDEAHTRGIDLKLPTDYRAALTLGANLTKDRLTQAAMRMRKLGEGQTLTFCVPEEIKRKVEDVMKKTIRDTGKVDNGIDISNIVQWAISETFADARRGMPLWATQGRRFVNHRHLWKEVHKAGVTRMTKEHSRKFREVEAQSLEHRYRPRQRGDANIMGRSAADVDHEDFGRIAERCGQFKDLNFRSSVLQEEQERELSPEIEQERHMQMPSAAEPLTPTLHEDVVCFWETGALNRTSEAFLPAFDTLQYVSAAAEFDVSRLSRDGGLLVTTDFSKTVKASEAYKSDAYQRSVQWILTSVTEDGNTVKDMVVISPFEANSLRGLEQKVRNVALHVYKPRISLAYDALDSLDFMVFPLRTSTPNIPSSLIVQLNLFAGQLYFTSYQAYLDTCNFLGIATESTTSTASVSGVYKSLVKFFKSFLEIVRRDGEGISKTHMGRLLDGGMLRREDFE